MILGVCGIWRSGTLELMLTSFDLAQHRLLRLLRALRGRREPGVVKPWVMTLGRVGGQVPNQQIPAGVRVLLAVAH